MLMPRLRSDTSLPKRTTLADIRTPLTETRAKGTGVEMTEGGVGGVSNTKNLDVVISMKYR